MKPQLVARLSKALKTEESESLVAAENQSESNPDGGSGEAQTMTSGDGGGSNNSNDIMHESASNDSIDIDMADIVVIDEYDSTKNDAKNESSSKRVCLQMMNVFAWNVNSLEVITTDFQSFATEFFKKIGRA